VPRKSDFVPCDWVNEICAHAQLTIRICIKEYNFALSARPMGPAFVMSKCLDVRMMVPVNIPFVRCSVVAHRYFRELRRRARFPVSLLRCPLFPTSIDLSDTQALSTHP